ncbi:hypothetical protein LTR08_000144 [Meristemomyces frigidus]|nr:hypothetical protein LTR08_000144 [Meristemomyces frigidus]
MIWCIGLAVGLVTLSSAQRDRSTFETITKTVTTLPFPPDLSASFVPTVLPAPASSLLYCATTTAYATTQTVLERYEATACTSYSTTTDPYDRTDVPTTTIYTGSFSASSVSTETLLSYGDLYKSGDLASTPACPPTGCSGTFTATFSGTQRTMITSGTSTVSTICPTIAYTGSTVSTTQDIRCAPSNLISAIDGNGIYRPTAVAGASTHYPPNDPVDASACCQQCLDTPDCAAGYSTSSDDNVEICALVITSASGGPALNYSDSAPFEYALLDPNGDEGVYRVSRGSGSVQPVVYESNCLPAS